jgi:hypothetical protein
MTRSPARRAIAPQGLLAIALVGATCAACANGDPGAATTQPACTPVPTVPVVLEGHAAAFDLSDVAEPIAVATTNGYLAIDARSTGAIPDLTIEFQQMLDDAGFDIAGSDDEGFEAEVFFARENVAAGQVVLTQSTCAGLVDVKITVLDHPAVFPDESGTPPG